MTSSREEQGALAGDAGFSPRGEALLTEGAPPPREGADEGRALVHQGPTRLQVARSLKEATPRMLVSLDARGQVRLAEDLLAAVHREHGNVEALAQPQVAELLADEARGRRHHGLGDAGAARVEHLAEVAQPREHAQVVRLRPARVPAAPAPAPRGRERPGRVVLRSCSYGVTTVPTE